MCPVPLSQSDNSWQVRGPHSIRHDGAFPDPNRDNGGCSNMMRTTSATRIGLPWLVRVWPGGLGQAWPANGVSSATWQSTEAVCGEKWKGLFKSSGTWEGQSSGLVVRWVGLTGWVTSVERRCQFCVLERLSREAILAETFLNKSQSVKRFYGTFVALIGQFTYFVIFSPLNLTNLSTLSIAYWLFFSPLLKW